jgi:alpha-tubulin suppressor-like RCC1 family protein
MVTDLGEVYCIGSGDAGQLGSGPLQRSAVWRRVKKLGQLSNGGIVANLAAGGDTTAAVVVNATGSNT